jgi:predicted metal-binding membrane protein
MLSLERRIAWATFGLLLFWAALAWALTAQSATAMQGMVMGLAQIGSRMPMTIGASVFGGMWLTMMVAMMFPTMGPMVIAHRMVTRNRGENWASTLAFIGGYLVVWTAAGILPFGAVVAFAKLPPGPAAPWIAPVAGGVLLAAGLYQFTPLKTICLRACRTPIGFILSHDFRTGAHGAFGAGLVHGAFCLGCCWALMAILVVVGVMNLVWMVALSAVFLLEKNWRGGIVLSRIVGIALAIIGVAVMLRPDVLSGLSGGAAPMPTAGPMRMYR